MLELRDVVVEVDQNSGDIQKIEPALAELRDHVLTHMNSSLPAPLELPGSFNKAVEQARKEAEARGQVDSGIYNQAQLECERLEVPLSIRAECIQNYVLANAPAGSQPQQIELPPKEQFIYSYHSPSWSFDLAGLSIALSFTLFAATWVKFFLGVVYPFVTSKIQSDPLE